jgi:hypothetical protein
MCRNRGARQLRVWLAGWLLAGGLVVTASAEGPGGCETHGTTVRWITSPDAAWRLARHEDKPVFLLHLSGNFAKDAFT